MGGCRAVLGTRTENQGLGRSPPPQGLGVRITPALSRSPGGADCSGPTRRSWALGLPPPPHLWFLKSKPRTHRIAHQVCSGVQVTALSSGPGPATSVKTLMLTGWYPGVEAPNGGRAHRETLLLADRKSVV